MSRDKVLKIRDLAISFKTSGGKLRAVRGVDLDVYRGETVAIVGESGSGKSVTVKAIMGILSKNGTIESGSIQYDYKEKDKEISQNLLDLSKKQMRTTINGKQIAMVFQDPMTSLDPTMSIGNQIMEGMRTHYNTPKEEAHEKAVRLLELVGITNPEERMKSYPHHLSGGMRQRIVIATALACDPDVLICDEPTTALDVTIQAKILELIQDIQRKTNIAVIYITHDLGVVAKVADYVNVMYAGKIVEKGTTDDIFYNPQHPYTWGLLLAMPDLETKTSKLYSIPGNPPNMTKEVMGDPFYPRNAYALQIDKVKEPPMFKVSDTHSAATWLLKDESPDYQLPIELTDRIERMRKEEQMYGITE
ncbi:ABC transporter ATP-binding protein [Jeotgalibaca sp. MA1X17-3]|uniref:ABC transporter ATP-binding protein n=1 Tax=Jeotgalibaca sp. MA1X17-3 TaxID=2908211 RepID=UPI0028832E39|nr:ABC transporter ATP-binding protein [Jeotgalibaca sp. MA1X17-3]